MDVIPLRGGVMSGRIFPAVALMLAVHVAAGQQPTDARVVAPPADSPRIALTPQCDAPNTANTYETCALRAEGFVIRQGVAGQVLDRPGIFHAVALTRLVAGDSATAYARMFERQQRRSQQLSVAAKVALLGGAALLLVDGQRSDTRRDGRLLLPAMTLGFVGFGLAYPSAVYSRHARTSLSTALWWNNSRFAR